MAHKKHLHNVHYSKEVIEHKKHLHDLSVKYKQEQEKDARRYSRKRYKYTSIFERGENAHESMSVKAIYDAGLYAGIYLKRALYDQRHENSHSRKHLFSALRGGRDVYFLARDMTYLYEFFADQFSNLHIVYGMSRTIDSETREELVREQIDPKYFHKTEDKVRHGLIVDTGFTGSMVKPVIELARKRKHHDERKPERILEGLLLTGSSGSYYPFISNAEKKHYGEIFRNLIVDLEHSPKTETAFNRTNSETYNHESGYACSVNKQAFLHQKAFTLGLRAGFMGLNKQGVTNKIKRDAKIRELKDRIYKVQESKRNLSLQFKKIDYIAKYGMQWEVARDGSIKTTGYTEITYNGYGQRFVFSTEEKAKRASVVFKARYARRYGIDNTTGLANVDRVYKQLHAKEEEIHYRIRRAKETTLAYIKSETEKINLLESNYSGLENVHSFKFDLW